MSVAHALPRSGRAGLDTIGEAEVAGPVLVRGGRDVLSIGGDGRGMSFACGDCSSIDGSGRGGEYENGE